MLCAFAIHRKEADRKEREKDILSFHLTDTEDEDSWKVFLANLKGRGLLGKHLKLIVADGNPALLIAVRSFYPFGEPPFLSEEAKLIFASENRKEALRRFRYCESKWRIEEERAVHCLKKDLFGCLLSFDFDKEPRKSIRTTNILERALREVRQRTRPMNNFFTNEASANRYGISDMLNCNLMDQTLKVISTN